MTKLRMDLNNLLKRDAYKGIDGIYDKGLITLEEAIKMMAERVGLEEDVFKTVKEDSFVMADMSEYDLLKKVRASSTDAHREYMRWHKEGVQV